MAPHVEVTDSICERQVFLKTLVGINSQFNFKNGN